MICLVNLIKGEIIRICLCLFIISIVRCYCIVINSILVKSCLVINGDYLILYCKSRCIKSNRNDSLSSIIISSSFCIDRIIRICTSSRKNFTCCRICYSKSCCCIKCKSSAKFICDSEYLITAGCLIRCIIV